MPRIVLALCAVIVMSTAAASQEATKVNFTQSTHTPGKVTPNATPRLADTMQTCETQGGWCFVYAPRPGSACRCCFGNGCFPGFTRVQ